MFSDKECSGDEIFKMKKMTKFSSGTRKKFIKVVCLGAH